MRTLFFLSAMFFALLGNAQDGTPVGDALAGNGKLNVVAVVVAVIILGMGLWMWRMDRKLGRMEKKMKD